MKLSDRSETIFLQTLSKQDFEKEDEDTVAALGVLSFAISELNFLQRQYQFLNHEFGASKEADWVNYAQRNALLRVFSAKLLEASKFVLLEGKYNRTSSLKLKKLLERFQKSFRWLERHPRYEIVKKLRNEATNHYKLQPARANLKILPDDTNFSFIYHQFNGNCFYGMGEAIMHYGNVVRFLGDTPKLMEEDKSLYDLWMHWNLATLKWLRRVHAHVAQDLMTDTMEGKVRKKIIDLPKGGAAVAKNCLTPLFIRE